MTRRLNIVGRNSEPEDPRGKCATCIYWSPRIGVGECRFRAPHTRQADTSHTRGWFPQTNDNDWCGEYDPAPYCGTAKGDSTCIVVGPHKTHVDLSGHQWENDGLLLEDDSVTP